MLGRFCWMHGTMADILLNVTLWVDKASLCKELIKRRTEISKLNLIQRPVLEIRLSHTLHQTYEKSIRSTVSIVCSANIARKIIRHIFFQPSKFTPVVIFPCNEILHLKIIQSLITSKCSQNSFRTLVWPSAIPTD